MFRSSLNIALAAGLAMVALTAVSCSKSKGGSEGDNVVMVDSDDKDMNAAMAQAGQTVQQFIAALQAPASGQTDFSVKKPFKQNGKVEHIWLTDVTFDGKIFHGRVGNDPEQISGIKMGDAATVGANEISDWMYIQNGKLIGGHTIRVLYDHSSPEDKTNFLKSVNFTMDK